MKKSLLFAAIALAAVSCGSQKSALESQNELLQQQVALQQQELQQQQAQQQQAQQEIDRQKAQQEALREEQRRQRAEMELAAAQKQRPDRAVRESEPCEDLALEESENLRSSGSAIANIEKVARNEAARDARSQLAQMMKVAVEGAAQDYELNANSDNKVTSETLSDVVINQYIVQDVENSTPIKWTVYDLSDGGIQVYTCVEMKKSEADVMQELSNKLGRDGVIEIEADRNRFIEHIQGNIDAYKEELKAKEE